MSAEGSGMCMRNVNRGGENSEARRAGQGEEKGYEAFTKMVVISKCAPVDIGSPTANIPR